MIDKLYRSSENKMIAGVCGGLAEYFNVDPVIVRLAFVISFFAWGSSFLIYLVLWVIMPSEQKIRSYSGDDAACLEEVVSEDRVKEKSNRRVFAALLLISIGVIASLENIPGFISFDVYFPLLMIGFGTYLLFKNNK